MLRKHRHLHASGTKPVDSPARQCPLTTGELTEAGRGSRRGPAPRNRSADAELPHSVCLHTLCSRLSCAEPHVVMTVYINHHVFQVVEGNSSENGAFLTPGRLLRAGTAVQRVPQALPLPAAASSRVNGRLGLRLAALCPIRACVVSQAPKPGGPFPRRRSSSSLYFSVCARGLLRLLCDVREGHTL